MKTYREIVDDIIKDFESRENININNTVINDALLDRLRDIAKNHDDVGIEDIFSMGTNCLYSIFDHILYINGIDTDDVDIIKESFEKNIPRLDRDDVDMVLDGVFSDSIENILDTIHDFRWIPKELDEIIDIGYEIFEGAKEAVLGKKKINNIDKYDELFYKMLKLRKVLHKMEYIYNSYEEIMQICDKELLDAAIELAVIKDTSDIYSDRLAEYKENHYTDEDIL